MSGGVSIYEWLPDIPFDAVCASAISPLRSSKICLRACEDMFFPGGVKAALEKEQDRAQRLVRNISTGMDTFGTLLIMSYILMSVDQVKAKWKEAEEAEEQAWAR